MKRLIRSYVEPSPFNEGLIYDLLDENAKLNVFSIETIHDEILQKMVTIVQRTADKNNIKVADYYGGSKYQVKNTTPPDLAFKFEIWNNKYDDFTHVYEAPITSQFGVDLIFNLFISNIDALHTWVSINDEEDFDYAFLDYYDKYGNQDVNVDTGQLYFSIDGYYSYDEFKQDIERRIIPAWKEVVEYNKDDKIIKKIYNDLKSFWQTKQNEIKKIWQKTENEISKELGYGGFNDIIYNLLKECDDELQAMVYDVVDSYTYNEDGTKII